MKDFWEFVGLTILGVSTLLAVIVIIRDSRRNKRRSR